LWQAACTIRLQRKAVLEYNSPHPGVMLSVPRGNRIENQQGSRSMQPKIDQLKRILNEVADLSAAASVLSWDQQTYMPEGGAEDRGDALATLSALAHKRFTSEETGRLLEDLAGQADQLNPDSDDDRLIRVTRHN
jgi:hypothetical protein